MQSQISGIDQAHFCRPCKGGLDNPRISRVVQDIPTGQPTEPTKGKPYDIRRQRICIDLGRWQWKIEIVFPWVASFAEPLPCSLPFRPFHGSDTIAPHTQQQGSHGNSGYFKGGTMLPTGLIYCLWWVQLPYLQDRRVLRRTRYASWLALDLVL